MSVKRKETVDRYVNQVAEIQAAIENLKEFVGTLPAPNEHGHLENVDYGHTGSVGRMHELIKEVSQFADSFYK